MITIITGNILESEAECLVNTVNCEGYMGKGIAYQFKKTFPLNNEDYVITCKAGKLTVGNLHSFKEKGKIIINFPTKDKWREKSKMSYVDQGLDKLVQFIKENEIKSIAIPPLGCGNGGLSWNEIQDLIVKKTTGLKNVDIIIHAPTLKNMNSNNISKAPSLNLSHLILMKYKMSLKKFGKIRLQKTAYFMNLFMGKNYFHFKPQTYGPYAHSIEILSKEIKEYQEYYKKDTNEAFEHSNNTLVSEKIKRELSNLDKTIHKATELVNSYTNTNLLELASTICYVIANNIVETDDDLIKYVHGWSKRKKDTYTTVDIKNSLIELQKKGLIAKDLMKYKLTF